MKIQEINKNNKIQNCIFASDPKKFYGTNIVKVSIDACDFLKLKNYGWYISKKGYVYTMISNHTILLHRMILNIKDKNIVVDHHDGNKLNNTRENLIPMTNKENLNKAWYKQNLYNTNKSVCMLSPDGSQILKTFLSEKEAANYMKQQNIRTSQGSISNACTGKSKTAGGYRWMYKDICNSEITNEGIANEYL